MKRRHPPAAKPRPSGGPARSPGLPLWKKVLFGAVTCSGFLLVMEMVLAVAGVKPILFQRDPYVGFSSQMPLFVKDHDSTDPGGMVTARNKQRIFNVQRFSNPKPANTYRIFCIGGSTTYGHPYDDKTSFCGWLRASLPKADPSRQWELINCGGISYASYREALLMEELIRYQPDLFIIYSAHNEFLEQRTYPELISMPRMVRGMGAALRQTRCYAAAKTMAEKFSAARTKADEKKKDVLPGEVETRLDRVVGPQAYHRDEEMERKVIDHFRFNTARMVEIARSAGARVVFVTPASNLRDCAPFKSESKKGLSEADYRRRQTLLRKLVAPAPNREWAQSLALADEALAVDDRYAELHYLRGRFLWELKRFPEAKAAFIRARDEDVCPLRALTPMIEIVRTIAAQQHVPMVDFVTRVEELSEQATPGNDWFLDHVHPTVEGNRQISIGLLEVLFREGVARRADSWNRNSEAEVKKSVESQIDSRANGLALCTAAKVIAWAGKAEEAFKLSIQAVQLAPGEAAVLLEAGKNAEQVGRHAEAIDYLRRAVELNPKLVEAHGLLGNALAAEGKNPAAIDEYKLALKIRPDHAEMHCNLATLLSKQGDVEGSIQHCREALRISPNYAEAHNNLAWSLKDKGKLTESLQHFREAVRLKPGLSVPTMGLAWLLATHPEAQQRDPAQAVLLGEKLAEWSHEGSWMALDTLAAAYAAAGRFGDAKTTAQRALELARKVSPGDAAAVAKRLALYEQGTSFRESQSF